MQEYKEHDFEPLIENNVTHVQFITDINYDIARVVLTGNIVVICIYFIVLLV